MRLPALFTMSILQLGVLASQAHADTTWITVRESVAVTVSPDVAWRAINNFNDSSWHPAVARTELLSGQNNAPQAVRALILKAGGRIVEQLQQYDGVHRALRYTMLDSPLPVTDYTAQIRVDNGDNGGSVMTWQARFHHKPVAGSEVSDEAVRKVIADIFLAGLGNLKTKLDAAGR